MPTPTLRFISHPLCPFVQRAGIALLEKDLPFERVDIDLASKPDWFLKLSPLGKVPVLVVGATGGEQTVLFESAVIAEYVDEVTGGGLLAAEPLARARQRAWIELASRFISDIGSLYNAASADLPAARERLRGHGRRLEAELGTGPWFAGAHFTLVDAAFGPAFRYFEVFSQLGAGEFFADLPRLSAWRRALRARDSVRGVVAPDYAAGLIDFLAARESWLGERAREHLAATERAA